MKVYLAGSMSGGRNFEDGILAIGGVLRELGHEIITPFVVDPSLNEQRFPGLTGKARSDAIFADDLKRLIEADVVVVDVSQPSHGVGIELGILFSLSRLLGDIKPTLCLRHESANGRLSSLIEGMPTVSEIKSYKPWTVEGVIKDFFAKINDEGRIRNERE